MRKTREQLRSERADLVCRELRHQFTIPHAEMNLNDALTLLADWMRVSPKIKYTRPNEKERTDKFVAKLRKQFL